MASDSMQISGFRLAGAWKQVREGLSLKRITFSKEGRFTDGRAVKIEPGLFKVGLPYIQACVDYNFWQHSILPDAKNFEAPSGLPLKKFIRRQRKLEPENTIVFACNSIYGNFWDANSVIISDGKIIHKTVSGIFQPVYRPPSGPFWFFVFDNNALGMKLLELKDGRLPAGASLCRNAVMGLPLLLAGVKQDHLIEQSQPAEKGNQVYYDPRNYLSAMSAVGINNADELIFAALKGDPDKAPEMIISEMAEGMRLLETRDAILLGTSADVQQFILGQKPRYLIANPQPSSTTGKFYKVRPLSSIITFSLI